MGSWAIVSVGAGCATGVAAIAAESPWSSLPYCWRLSGGSVGSCGLAVGGSGWATGATVGTLAPVSACSVGACVVDSWVDLRSGPDAPAAVGAVCTVGTAAGPSELLPPQAEVRAIAPNRAGTTSNKIMIRFMPTIRPKSRWRIPSGPHAGSTVGRHYCSLSWGFNIRGVAPTGQPNGGTLQVWRTAVPACNILTDGRHRAAMLSPGPVGSRRSSAD